MGGDEGGRERLLSVSVDREGDAVTVSARGEVDMGTADLLDGELQNAESSDARRIVLDLSRVSFIDSTGLQLLVEAARRSDREPARLVVVQGFGAVARMLSLTGIGEFLTLVYRDGLP